MNNNILNKFFAIIVVILFTFIICVSVYFNYYNWQVRKQSNLITNTLTFIKTDNKSISEKKDYYNSQNYKEKLFKTENLKNKDEVIVRMENLEVYIKEGETEYIVKQKNEKNNVGNWIDCLFIKNISISQENFCR